ncbi:hypothetical protein GCM10027614_00990 [Micromonospora vulcania]
MVHLSAVAAVGGEGPGFPAGVARRRGRLRRGYPPPHPVLVLLLQQLDVLQLQQLEQEQLELDQSMTIASIASTSSISNVSVSNARSSSVSSGIPSTSPRACAGLATDRPSGATAGAEAQLVLLQLDEVQLQQLDVLQLEQLDVLVLLLQMSIWSADRSAMSSTSNVSVCRSRSSP